MSFPDFVFRDLRRSCRVCSHFDREPKQMMMAYDPEYHNAKIPQGSCVFDSMAWNEEYPHYYVSCSGSRTCPFFSYEAGKSALNEWEYGRLHSWNSIVTTLLNGGVKFGDVFDEMSEFHPDPLSGYPISKGGKE